MAVADNYQAFSFTPNGQQALLLGGTLEALDHDLGSRLASFEYLKRDGGEIEPMGASQARFSYRSVLVGMAPLTQGGPAMSPGQRYAALVKAQRSQPRGILVDPRLGRWQVGWSHVRATEQPARAVDLIEVALEFIEDQLDQSVAIESQPTPQRRAFEVTTASTALTTAMAARYAASTIPVMQAVQPAGLVLTTSAGIFAESCLAAAQNSTPDPALPQLLGSVAAKRDAFLATLAATLSYTLEPDVSLTPYRDSAREVYAACAQLYAATIAQLPPIIPFTVPAAMPLSQVAVVLYGKDARGKISELRLLNRIANPAWIPVGTVLQVTAPQVSQ